MPGILQVEHEKAATHCLFLLQKVYAFGTFWCYAQGLLQGLAGEMSVHAVTV